MSARTSPADAVTYQGQYAGSVSRFTAYVIDLAVSTGVFTLGLAAISYGAQVVTGHSVHWNRSNIVVAILFVVWEFFYFGYSWAVSGKTFGMAVLGIRVVAVDGSDLEPRRGVVRALVFPLSFLLFGLGFLGILVQREHRALHDLIAGSAVIYAWDARAARLRFLARQAELPASGSAPPGPAVAPPALLWCDSPRGAPAAPSRREGEHALKIAIAGGSAAGLFAALLLARAENDVVVLERDPLEPAPDVESAAATAFRPSAPQIVQPHLIMARCRQLPRPPAATDRVSYPQLRAAGCYDPVAFRAFWKINGMVCPPEAVYTDPHVVACTREALSRHGSGPLVAQPTREQLLAALAA
jgi:uncharacterized RDD family membrane protein YckC